MMETTPSVDAYWASLESTLPTFTADEQHAAVALYRVLALGSPVRPEQLDPDVRARLDRPCIRDLTYSDATGRIIGFGGLAVQHMHHTFRIEGRTLWTWCAWDSLFIPGILGVRAEVESPDPETRELVRLVVTPERVVSVEPKGAVVSFVRPEPGAFTGGAVVGMATFCHYIFYFGSSEAGERWVTRHPGTFLYPMESAFALAQRLVRQRYPQV